MIKGSNYLFVDGYNIINSWKSLFELMNSISLDAARDELINYMEEYQTLSGEKVILVFDAYMVKGISREDTKDRTISVIYTKENETADNYIEKQIDLLKRHDKFRVATSDGMIQKIILGKGGTRVSANELHLDYNSLKSGSKRNERKNRTYSSKNIVSIDEELQRKLEEFKSKLE